MVKSKTLIKIHSILNNHKNFISNDFSLENKNSSLRITYNYDDSFHFSVSFPNAISQIEDGTTERNVMGMTRVTGRTRTGYKFRGSMKPGKVATHENFEVEGIDRIFREISDWLDNVWDELVVAPELRILLENSNEIESVKKSFEKIENEKFSKEEAVLIIDKLNELEEQFQKQLKQNAENEKYYSHAVEELHNEIENLKLLVYSLKKRGWFSSFGTRIFKWYSKEENRKMIKDGMDLIKPLLPEGTDNIIQK